MTNQNMIDLRNMDCMELLASLPDKSIDLAIVDPPYGENCDLEMSKSRWHYKNGFGKTWLKGKQSIWNVEPPKEYFTELFRVSKNQIVWGANHFIQKIPNQNSSCWLIWDKGQRDFSFADAELAWDIFQKNCQNF